MGLYGEVNLVFVESRYLWEDFITKLGDHTSNDNDKNEKRKYRTW